MENQDAKSAANWQDSYSLKKTINLWGDDYVPFADKATDIFKSIINGYWYLDLPCGDGRNLSRLCKDLPVVIGADYSLNALEISRKRMHSEKIINSVLHTCDIFKTGYLDEQFDGIFCWDLLGHLVLVEDALQELLRIIKPGGILIGSIFTNNDSTIQDPLMKNIHKDEYLYNDKFYFKYYNESTARQLLEKTGAKIVSVESAGWMEGPHEGYREYPHYHESWAFVLEKV